MSIEVERLAGLEDWRACERLELEVRGEHPARPTCGLPTLRAIHDSGGLILGAWDTPAPERVLAGALVDLSGTHEGFPGLFTLFLGVSPRRRNAGVASALRRAERAAAADRGVEVVRWWIDPLRGDEAHLALNRLGAVGSRYERNVLGELHDRQNAGLVTDRVGVEWWVRAPRTAAVVDEGRLAAHYQLGFHEMAVLTRTTVGPSGQRVLLDLDRSVTGSHLLVEVPVHLDPLREAAPDEARRWRLATRDVFERLLAEGYLLVGLIHEAGRSFQLLEAADLGAVLGR
ncbi:MAG: hypothetical protein PHU43_07885 [Candidatus Bipolaricaulis sp.]|nr:hypothetical protein [Candidatus Bipolaricaulis sp.]